jgi:hypothetical protein
MNWTNIALLGWAALCLGAAYFAGRRRKNAKFWKWADPIYYPLAIAGIALLFFSNENTRAIADLRDQLADVEELIAEHRAERPPSDVGEAGAGSGKLEQAKASAAALAKLEARKKATEDDIAGMQRAAPVTVFQWIVGFVLSRLWPFVLVLALALKFAKGIAAL